MDLQTFQTLPTEEVARLVREAGTKVCVFPVKGTRRWFALEYPLPTPADYAAAYLDAVFGKHIDVYGLCFAHGIETLLTPSFDLPLMERGDAYMKMAAEGLASLARHPDFLSFYEAHNVRVRFYGDYRKFLSPTPYAYLIDLFDELMARTAVHTRHRLFFGLFVHDATETTAALAVQYYQQHGVIPDRRALVEQYYGEYVDPADMFIGFSKLRAFDMPLLASGKTDLYFTVSPSLYLTEAQLRAILYDHLYTRRQSTQRDYAALSPDDLAAMKAFYTQAIGQTLGVGVWNDAWQCWYPLIGNQKSEMSNE
ncbi:MAG TPA: diterpene synthase [Anaerolineae bacterium]|nr:diterpene synthase [Anaerolineae bacterium]